MYLINLIKKKRNPKQWFYFFLTIFLIILFSPILLVCGLIIIITYFIGYRWTKQHKDYLIWYFKYHYYSVVKGQKIEEENFEDSIYK